MAANWIVLMEYLDVFFPCGRLQIFAGIGMCLALGIKLVKCVKNLKIGQRFKENKNMLLQIATNTLYLVKSTGI